MSSPHDKPKRTLLERLRLPCTAYEGIKVLRALLNEAADAIESAPSHVAPLIGPQDHATVIERVAYLLGQGGHADYADAIKKIFSALSTIETHTAKAPMEGYKRTTPRTDALLLVINEGRVYEHHGSLVEHARQLEIEVQVWEGRCREAEANATQHYSALQAARSAIAPKSEPVWVWGLTQEGIRDEVAQFAALMERKLKANDHKDHWEGAPMGYLLRRLKEEVEELERAVRSSNDAETIGGEAADVGNFAMMIADNMASLPQLPAHARADGGVKT